MVAWAEKNPKNREEGGREGAVFPSIMSCIATRINDDDSNSNILERTAEDTSFKFGVLIDYEEYYPKNAKLWHRMSVTWVM